MAAVWIKVMHLLLSLILQMYKVVQTDSDRILDINERSLQQYIDRIHRWSTQHLYSASMEKTQEHLYRPAQSALPNVSKMQSH